MPKSYKNYKIKEKYFCIFEKFYKRKIFLKILDFWMKKQKIKKIILELLIFFCQLKYKNKENPFVIFDFDWKEKNGKVYQTFNIKTGLLNDS